MKLIQILVVRTTATNDIYFSQFFSACFLSYFVVAFNKSQSCKFNTLFRINFGQTKTLYNCSSKNKYKRNFLVCAWTRHFVYEIVFQRVCISLYISVKADGFLFLFLFLKWMDIYLMPFWIIVSGQTLFQRRCCNTKTVCTVES